MGTRKAEEELYSKSTIKRAADKLVKKGLIAAEELSSGTLFTVLDTKEISFFSKALKVFN
ncbi:hypothetical protein V7161_26105 [Neobacillus drentensis]|uniref:hypothetical protein n=1 Tax=Neobacillus drentensis TaxID=220684 RepID=UPI003002D476